MDIKYRTFSHNSSDPIKVWSCNVLPWPQVTLLVGNFRGVGFHGRSSNINFSHLTFYAWMCMIVPCMCVHTISQLQLLFACLTFVDLIFIDRRLYLWNFCHLFHFCIDNPRTWRDRVFLCLDDCNIQHWRSRCCSSGGICREVSSLLASSLCGNHFAHRIIPALCHCCEWLDDGCFWVAFRCLCWYCGDGSICLHWRKSCQLWASICHHATEWGRGNQEAQKVKNKTEGICSDYVHWRNIISGWSRFVISTILSEHCHCV